MVVLPELARISCCRRCKSAEFRACRTSRVKDTGRPEAWANHHHSRGGTATQTHRAQKYLKFRTPSSSSADASKPPAEPVGPATSSSSGHVASSPVPRRAESGGPGASGCAGLSHPATAGRRMGRGGRLTRLARLLRSTAGVTLAMTGFSTPGGYSPDCEQREADARSGHSLASDPIRAGFGEAVSPPTSARAWGTRCRRYL